MRATEGQSVRSCSRRTTKLQTVDEAGRQVARVRMEGSERSPELMDGVGGVRRTSGIV